MWLFSLSIMFSGLICVIVCIHITFPLWLNSIPLCGYNTSLIFMVLGHFLALVDNTAVNIHIQVFVWTYVFTFLG